jgi:two-component system NarL family sensor kinase
VLPYAGVYVDGEPWASSGVEVTHTRSVPLPLEDGRAARLVVGLRPGDLALTGADHAALRLVVPLLALAFRMQLLASDLQEWRTVAVAAREEEHRRMRRDLHDGLGPRLTGIAFTADAVRNNIAEQPEKATVLVAELRAEAAAAIEDIRGLVYGIRPPALDELGLVAAVRQQARTLRTPAGEPLAVEVTADPMSGLPAAVEVATYRIAVEALTNVARHADARRARVRLTCSATALEVTVQDDGAGREDWGPGVGLSAMRERAHELGGTFAAGPGAGGGQVHAVLPL